MQEQLSVIGAFESESIVLETVKMKVSIGNIILKLF